MNETTERKRLAERAIEPIANLNNAQTKTMSNDIIVSASHKYATLLGRKITRVTFQNKEYLLKANRYLLLLILKYLIENNKIDLKEELPLKTSENNIRSLFNTKPFHSDNYPMSDMLYLKCDNESFYIGVKLDTNAIHYTAFYLLGRYKIPIENLEIQYSEKRRKIPGRYVKKLKRQGYCLVEDLNTNLCEKYNSRNTNNLNK